MTFTKSTDKETREKKSADLQFINSLLSQRQTGGRISRTGAITKLQLLKLSYNQYHISTCRNIAFAILRDIKDTPVRLRKTVFFIREVHNKLLILNNYNRATFQSKGKFPYCKALILLLVSYVQLEYDVLYRTENYSVKYEKEVERRILCLLHIMLDGVEKKFGYKNTKNAATKCALRILNKVHSDYKKEGKLICSLITKLITKLGLLDIINKIKGNGMRLHENDPSVQMLSCDSIDYISDCESDDSMEFPTPPVQEHTLSPISDKVKLETPVKQEPPVLSAPYDDKEGDDNFMSAKVKVENNKLICCKKESNNYNKSDGDSCFDLKKELRNSCSCVQIDNSEFNNVAIQSTNNEYNFCGDLRLSNVNKILTFDAGCSSSITTNLNSNSGNSPSNKNNLKRTLSTLNSVDIINLDDEDDDVIEVIEDTSKPIKSDDSGWTIFPSVIDITADDIEDCIEIPNNETSQNIEKEFISDNQVNEVSSTTGKELVFQNVQAIGSVHNCLKNKDFEDMEKPVQKETLVEMNPRLVEALRNMNQPSETYDKTHNMGTYTEDHENIEELNSSTRTDVVYTIENLLAKSINISYEDTIKTTAECTTPKCSKSEEEQFSGISIPNLANENNFLQNSTVINRRTSNISIALRKDSFEDIFEEMLFDGIENFKVSFVKNSDNSETDTADDNILMDKEVQIIEQSKLEADKCSENAAVKDKVAISTNEIQKRIHIVPNDLKEDTVSKKEELNKVSPQFWNNEEAITSMDSSNIQNLSVNELKQISTQYYDNFRIRKGTADIDSVPEQDTFASVKSRSPDNRCGLQPVETEEYTSIIKETYSNIAVSELEVLKLSREIVNEENTLISNSQYQCPSKCKEITDSDKLPDFQSSVCEDMVITSVQEKTMSVAATELENMLTASSKNVEESENLTKLIQSQNKYSEHKEKFEQALKSSCKTVNEENVLMSDLQDQNISKYKEIEQISFTSTEIRDSEKLHDFESSDRENQGIITTQEELKSIVSSNKNVEENQNLEELVSLSSTEEVKGDSKSGKVECVYLSLIDEVTNPEKQQESTSISRTASLVREQTFNMVASDLEQELRSHFSNKEPMVSNIDSNHQRYEQQNLDKMKDSNSSIFEGQSLKLVETALSDANLNQLTSFYENFEHEASELFDEKNIGGSQFDLLDQQNLQENKRIDSSNEEDGSSTSNFVSAIEPQIFNKKEGPNNFEFMEENLATLELYRQSSIDSIELDKNVQSYEEKSDAILRRHIADVVDGILKEVTTLHQEYSIEYENSKMIESIKEENSQVNDNEQQMLCEEQHKYIDYIPNSVPIIEKVNSDTTTKEVQPMAAFNKIEDKSKNVCSQEPEKLLNCDTESEVIQSNVLCENQDNTWNIENKDKSKNVCSQEPDKLLNSDAEPEVVQSNVLCENQYNTSNIETSDKESDRHELVETEINNTKEYSKINESIENSREMNSIEYQKLDNVDKAVENLELADENAANNSKVNLNNEIDDTKGNHEDLAFSTSSEKRVLTKDAGEFFLLVKAEDGSEFSRSNDVGGIQCDGNTQDENSFYTVDASDPTNNNDEVKEDNIPVNCVDRNEDIKTKGHVLNNLETLDSSEVHIPSKKKYTDRIDSRRNNYDFPRIDNEVFVEYYEYQSDVITTVASENLNQFQSVEHLEELKNNDQGISEDEINKNQTEFISLNELDTSTKNSKATSNLDLHIESHERQIEEDIEKNAKKNVDENVKLITEKSQMDAQILVPCSKPYSSIKESNMREVDKSTVDDKTRSQFCDVETTHIVTYPKTNVDILTEYSKYHSSTNSSCINSEKLQCTETIPSTSTIIATSKSEMNKTENPYSSLNLEYINNDTKFVQPEHDIPVAKITVMTENFKQSFDIPLQKKCNGTGCNDVKESYVLPTSEQSNKEADPDQNLVVLATVAAAQKSLKVDPKKSTRQTRSRLKMARRTRKNIEKEQSVITFKPNEVIESVTKQPANTVYATTSEVDFNTVSEDSCDSFLGKLVIAEESSVFDEDTLAEKIIICSTPLGDLENTADETSTSETKCLKSRKILNKCKQKIEKSKESHGTQHLEEKKINYKLDSINDKFIPQNVEEKLQTSKFHNNNKPNVNINNIKPKSLTINKSESTKERLSEKVGLINTEKNIDVKEQSLSVNKSKSTRENNIQETLSVSIPYTALVESKIIDYNIKSLLKPPEKSNERKIPDASASIDVNNSTIKETLPQKQKSNDKQIDQVDKIENVRENLIDRNSHEVEEDRCQKQKSTAKQIHQVDKIENGDKDLVGNNHHKVINTSRNRSENHKSLKDESQIIIGESSMLTHDGEILQINELTEHERLKKYLERKEYNKIKNMVKSKLVENFTNQIKSNFNKVLLSDCRKNDQITSNIETSILKHSAENFQAIKTKAELKLYDKKDRSNINVKPNVVQDKFKLSPYVKLLRLSDAEIQKQRLIKPKYGFSLRRKSYNDPIGRRKFLFQTARDLVSNIGKKQNMVEEACGNDDSKGKLIKYSKIKSKEVYVKNVNKNQASEIEETTNKNLKGVKSSRNSKPVTTTDKNKLDKHEEKQSIDRKKSDNGSLEEISLVKKLKNEKNLKDNDKNQSINNKTATLPTYRKITRSFSVDMRAANNSDTTLKYIENEVKSSTTSEKLRKFRKTTRSFSFDSKKMAIPLFSITNSCDNKTDDIIYSSNEHISGDPLKKKIDSMGNESNLSNNAFVSVVEGTIKEGKEKKIDIEKIPVSIKAELAPLKNDEYNNILSPKLPTLATIETANDKENSEEGVLVDTGKIETVKTRTVALNESNSKFSTKSPILTTAEKDFDLLIKPIEKNALKAKQRKEKGKYSNNKKEKKNENNVATFQKDLRDTENEKQCKEKFHNSLENKKDSKCIDTINSEKKLVNERNLGESQENLKHVSIDKKIHSVTASSIEKPDKKNINKDEDTKNPDSEKTNLSEELLEVKQEVILEKKSVAVKRKHFTENQREVENNELKSIEDRNTDNIIESKKRKLLIENNKKFSEINQSIQGKDLISEEKEEIIGIKVEASAKIGLTDIKAEQKGFKKIKPKTFKIEDILETNTTKKIDRSTPESDLNEDHELKRNISENKTAYERDNANLEVEFVHNNDSLLQENYKKMTKSKLEVVSLEKLQIIKENNTSECKHKETDVNDFVTSNQELKVTNGELEDHTTDDNKIDNAKLRSETVLEIEDKLIIKQEKILKQYERKSKEKKIIQRKSKQENIESLSISLALRNEQKIRDENNKICTFAAKVHAAATRGLTFKENNSNSVSVRDLHENNSYNSSEKQDVSSNIKNETLDLSDFVTNVLPKQIDGESQTKDTQIKVWSANEKTDVEFSSEAKGSTIETDYTSKVLQRSCVKKSIIKKDSIGMGQKPDQPKYITYMPKKKRVTFNIEKQIFSDNTDSEFEGQKIEWTMEKLNKNYELLDKSEEAKILPVIMKKDGLDDMKQNIEEIKLEKKDTIFNSKTMNIDYAQQPIKAPKLEKFSGTMQSIVEGLKVTNEIEVLILPEKIDLKRNSSEDSEFIAKKSKIEDFPKIEIEKLKLSVKNKLEKAEMNIENKKPTNTSPTKRKDLRKKGIDTIINNLRNKEHVNNNIISEEKKKGVKSEEQAIEQMLEKKENMDEEKIEITIIDVIDKEGLINTDEHIKSKVKDIDICEITTKEKCFNINGISMANKILTLENEKVDKCNETKNSTVIEDHQTKASEDKTVENNKCREIKNSITVINDNQVNTLENENNEVRKSENEDVDEDNKIKKFTIIKDNQVKMSQNKNVKDNKRKASENGNVTIINEAKVVVETNEQLDSTNSIMENETVENIATDFIPEIFQAIHLQRSTLVEEQRNIKNLNFITEKTSQRTCNNNLASTSIKSTRSDFMDNISSLEKLKFKDNSTNLVKHTNSNINYDNIQKTCTDKLLNSSNKKIGEITSNRIELKEENIDISTSIPGKSSDVIKIPDANLTTSILHNTTLVKDSTDCNANSINESLVPKNRQPQEMSLLTASHSDDVSDIAVSEATQMSNFTSNDINWPSVTRSKSFLLTDNEIQNGNPMQSEIFNVPIKTEVLDVVYDKPIGYNLQNEITEASSEKDGLYNTDVKQETLPELQDKNDEVVCLQRTKEQTLARNILRIPVPSSIVCKNDHLTSMTTQVSSFVTDQILTTSVNGLTSSVNFENISLNTENTNSGLSKDFDTIDEDDTPVTERLKVYGTIQIGSGTTSGHNYGMGGPLLGGKCENNELHSKQLTQKRQRDSTEDLDNSPVDNDNIFPFAEQPVCISSLIDNNLAQESNRPLNDSPVDGANDFQLSEQFSFPLIENQDAEYIEMNFKQRCDSDQVSNINSLIDYFNAPMSVEKMNTIQLFHSNPQLTTADCQEIVFGVKSEMNDQNEHKFPLANLDLHDIDKISFTDGNLKVNQSCNYETKPITKEVKNENPEKVTVKYNEYDFASTDSIKKLNCPETPQLNKNDMINITDVNDGKSPKKQIKKNESKPRAKKILNEEDMPLNKFVSVMRVKALIDSERKKSEAKSKNMNSGYPTRQNNKTPVCAPIKTASPLQNKKSPEQRTVSPNISAEDPLIIKSELTEDKDLSKDTGSDAKDITEQKDIPNKLILDSNDNAENKFEDTPSKEIVIPKEKPKADIEEITKDKLNTLLCNFSIYKPRVETKPSNLNSTGKECRETTANSNVKQSEVKISSDFYIDKYDAIKRKQRQCTDRLIDNYSCEKLLKIEEDAKNRFTRQDEIKPKKLKTEKSKSRSLVDYDSSSLSDDQPSKYGRYLCKRLADMLDESMTRKAKQQRRMTPEEMFDELVGRSSTGNQETKKNESKPTEEKNKSFNLNSDNSNKRMEINLSFPTTSASKSNLVSRQDKTPEMRPYESKAGSSHQWELRSYQNKVGSTPQSCPTNNIILNSQYHLRDSYRYRHGSTEQRYSSRSRPAASGSRYGNIPSNNTKSNAIRSTDRNSTPKNSSDFNWLNTMDRILIRPPVTFVPDENTRQQRS